MSNPTPTQITSAFNALVSLLQTALPDHKRLAYADDLEANDKHSMRLGWGIVFGGGINSKRNICPNYARRRTFTIVLTRENTAKDTDVVKKDQNKVWLLEDLHLVLNQIEQTKNLDGATINCEAETDDGPVESEVEGFLVLELTVTIENIQQVSGGN